MKLGMNLSACSYGQTDLKFLDLRLSSHGWSNTPPGWQGWLSKLPPNAPAGQKQPESIPATQGYFRPGTYTVACDGTGTIGVVSNDIPGGYKECKFIEGQPTYDIPLSKQADHPTFRVIANDVNSKYPLNNLQLLPPATAAGRDWRSYWDQVYLASVAAWNGPLRSMNWLGTIQSPVTDWASANRNEAIGPMGLVDLANRTGKDVWYNLPVRTLSESGISDYGSQLGAYLAANADPHSTWMFEIGDEFWNGGGAWSVDRGYLNNLAPKLCDPATGKNLGYGGWPAAAAYGLHYLVEAIKSQIDPAKGPKIKRVVSGQCAYWANGMVDSQISRLNGLGSSPDAIACAPYADWENTGQYTMAAVSALVAAGNVSAAVDLIIAGLQDRMTNLIVPSLQIWQAKAKSYGVPLYYYEMGLDYQGLFNSSATHAAAALIRDDPRGGALTSWYLAQVAPFADLGCWFDDCTPGVWGSRANADDTTKSQVRAALLAYVAANP